MSKEIPDACVTVDWEIRVVFGKLKWMLPFHLPYQYKASIV